jgi:hypothetical protein
MTDMLRIEAEGQAFGEHLDAVHAMAGRVVAGDSRNLPERVRVEGLEQSGTSLQPRWSIALGPSTPARIIANLGAAPAFGGWTGQFYRITASAGLIALWGLGVAAIYGGLPHYLAYAAFSAAVVYVGIQPLLGVWARATLRPGRLEVRDVDGNSDLGRIIGCYRHVMALSPAFRRVGDQRALVGELRRMLWEAILLDQDGQTAAVAELFGHFSAVTATLEQLVLGRSPAAQAEADRVVEESREARRARASQGIAGVAAAQVRTVLGAAGASVVAFEAVHETSGPTD